MTLGNKSIANDPSMQTGLNVTSQKSLESRIDAVSSADRAEWFEHNVKEICNDIRKDKKNALAQNKDKFVLYKNQIKRAQALGAVLYGALTFAVLAMLAPVSAATVFVASIGALVGMREAKKDIKEKHYKPWDAADRQTEQAADTLYQKLRSKMIEATQTSPELLNVKPALADFFNSATLKEFEMKPIERKLQKMLEREGAEISEFAKKLKEYKNDL